ncbi:MAG: hypothetical protein ACOYOF_18935 [Verrucomicrobiaceae bacterium]|jgi:hypothetical protein
MHTPESDLRVIKTARTEEAINEGAKAGFWPVVQKVKPLKKIHSKFAVFQSEQTGEIKVCGDFRGLPGGDFKQVIGWTRYYPHVYPEPFAAYLVPKDIKKGETVWLEDVIEDQVGYEWNQGDVFRLESCEAVWNGKKLVLKFNPKTDVSHRVG